jgi:chromosome segregation ATPase
MKQKILSVATLIILIGISSCVSKKKYLEMESFKLRAENRVRELTGENETKDKRIETMIADFEKMKGQQMESNAVKNQMIDSLTGKVNVLSSDVSAKDASIEEKIYAFEYEKRRLTEEATSAKQQLLRKETELGSLSAQLSEMKNEISRLNFDLGRGADELKTMQGQLQAKEEKIAGNQQEVDKLKTEIQNLKKQLTGKDQAIEKLENNVKLLKSQLK